MFTGIVAAIGSIRQVSPLGEDGVRLDVAAEGLDMSDVAIGDSIAIQGACMTVVEKTADGFAVDVSAESLRRTTGLAATGPVNLEKAMRLSDRVGGHLVSGHVDGLGVVRRFEPVGESHLLEILAPQALAGFLVYKGSITVDGVSLTVCRASAPPPAGAGAPRWGGAAGAVRAGRGPSVASSGAPGAAAGAHGGAHAETEPWCCAFQINLIPHTVAQTTLKHQAPGRLVNLEIDTVARYLARMQEVAGKLPAQN